MPKRRRILVVDDDALLLDSVQRGLHSCPFDVDTENCAESALLRLGAHNYDIVIVDIRMPGMGGITLCGIIASEFPGPLIMLLSGHYTTADLIAAINIGHIYKVLEKPCPLHELKASIISALSHKANLEHSYIAKHNEDYYPHDH